MERTQPGETETERQTTDATYTDDLQGMANVERLLREDRRCFDVSVRVGENGARIGFNTADHNSHTRGSITATLVHEIAATAGWVVTTVHDPIDLEDGVTGSMLTLLHRPDEEGGR